MAPTLLSLPTETLLAVASYLNSAADYIHLSRAHQSIARKLEDRRVVAKTVKVSVLQELEAAQFNSEVTACCWL